MFAARRSFSAAVADFRQARQQAALEEIVARLTGKSVTLLSYEQVRATLRARGNTPRGVQEIPIDAIVGSVGRYADFTRSFLPRQSGDESRWAHVMAAADDASELPPIEVYQIGQAYFVLDGNHRVSIARRQGIKFVSAYVRQVHTSVPLDPSVQPDDLIIKAEEAAFLEYTGLDQTCSGSDLAVTAPGQYAHLENYIEAHRYLMEEDQGREIPLAEAACQWYELVYTPVVEAIRRQGILRDLRGRTETDLFVWTSLHRLELQRELGWPLRTEVAITDLVDKFSSRPEHIAARVGRGILQVVMPDPLDSGPPTGQWRIQHLPGHSSGHLFEDVLVALNGDEAGWRALDQALEIARREEAWVHGFHVASTEEQLKGDQARSVQAEFQRRCESAGLAGRLAFQVGPIASSIAERSRWVDLVVLSLSYPPEPQLAARLASGLRTILLNCTRPVLAVPGPASRLERALLAFDGSSKSDEALFVATYLAGQWKMPLVVAAVEGERAQSQNQSRVQVYLDEHGVPATFAQPQGQPAEAILDAAHAHGCDWIIMGSYTQHPLVEAMFGSVVDHVLRASRLPMLICR
jgi:nucleotide-binding universal stress UspA family protein